MTPATQTVFMFKYSALNLSDMLLSHYLGKGRGALGEKKVGTCLHLLSGASVKEEPGTIQGKIKV